MKAWFKVRDYKRMPHRGKTMRQYRGNRRRRSWVSVCADESRLGAGGLLRERRGLHSVLKVRHFGEFLRALREADAARRDLARLAGFAERGDDQIGRASCR